MRRKGLAKRVLAITLAAMMAGSVVNGSGILEARAEEATAEDAFDVKKADAEEGESANPKTDSEEQIESTGETAPSEKKNSEEKEAEETKTTEESEKKKEEEKQARESEEKDTKEEYKLAEAEVQTETVELDPELLEDLPDNEDLFDEYVWEILYGESEIATFGTTAYDRLGEKEKSVYNVLKPQIQSVAAGNTTSTVFTVKLSDFGIENNSFTKDDLGVESIYQLKDNTYRISEEAGKKMEAMVKYDFQAVLNALLCDCPYDLYWFDKTEKFSYSVFAPNLIDTNTAYFYPEEITISLKPAQAYKGEQDYTVNSEKINAAKTAAANARAIVDKYKGQSDYARLKAYKDEICALVSYNYDAAEDSYVDTNGYGDPWQLIYVFDGDVTTNVVCEGYSKAFQYLCDLDGGLTCYSVSGTLGGGTGAGAHMWNIVALDGSNYLVDVTNCDGTEGADSNTIGYPDKLFLAGASTQTEGESYTITFEAWTQASASVSYSYDNDTKNTYSKEELTLAASKYVEKVVPTFTVTVSENETAVYDGSTHTITVKDGETALTEGIDYTVKILKDGSEVSEIKDAGTYSITVTGTEAHEGKGTASYTITQRSLDNSFTITLDDKTSLTRLYTGAEIKPTEKLLDASSHTLTKEHDYQVSYSSNTAVGTATVTITGRGNYTGSITKTFEIQIGNFDSLSGQVYYNDLEYKDAEKNNIWFCAPADITAKVGETAYLVSTTQDGTYTESCSFASDEKSVTKTFYFRNPSTGETYSKELTLQFDKTAPTGKIQLGAKAWDKLFEVITFGRYRGNANAITIEGTDSDSGIAKIEYLISEIQKTKEDLEAATFTLYNATSKPSAENNKNQIIYAKLTDKAGNVSYLSSNGFILDTTAPVISSLEILTDASLTDTEFKFQFQVNEAGTYYYLVRPASDNQTLSATDIITAATTGSNALAGTGETGGLVDGSASVEKTVTGLQAKTAYQVYVVAQDQVYNLDTTEETRLPNTSDIAASAAVTTKQSIPVVTKTPALSGMYGTAVKDLQVTAGEVKAGEQEISGTWQVAAGPDGSLEKILSVDTGETCTLTFTPDNAGYAAVTVDVVPTITKRPVRVIIGSESKTYGTENPTFTHTYGEGAGYASVLDGDNLGITLSTTATKESAVGFYEITGTASNLNYQVTFTGGANAFTITKASAPAAAEDSISYAYLSGSKGTVTIDLTEELSLPADCGSVSYELQTQDTNDILEKAEISDTSLSYEVKAGKAYKGKEAVLTVTVHMKNYQDTTYELTIQLTEKNPVSCKNVSVKAGQELTYGEALGSLSLEGDFIDENAEAVAGTLTWKEPTVKPNAGTTTAEWIFTPDDGYYQTVTGSIEIAVKKATPSVTVLPKAEGLTYGQKLSESALTGGEASVNGTFSWTKADTRPEVQDSDSTEYDMTFTPADTTNWKSVTVKQKVKVSKKSLTWDGSGLTILTKLQDGSKEAVVTGKMRLSGILDGDDAGFTYTQLKAEFDTANVGTDKQVTVTIDGAALKNANYSLPDTDTWLGKGIIEKTETMKEQTDLESTYRLVISEKDKAEVTSELAENEKLNTSAKIVEYLKKLLVERKTDGKTPAKENTEVYDVLLLHSTDGVNWTRVTAENFPKDGVKVTLPYPENTNKADYQFQAVHMFTIGRTEADGTVYHAGDVETPALTLTEDGITMTLKSLSPVALSWVKLEKASTNGSEGSNSGSISSGGNHSAGTSIKSAETADHAQPAAWGMLAVLCLMGICITAELRARKRRNK